MFPYPIQTSNPSFQASASRSNSRSNSPQPQPQSSVSAEAFLAEEGDHSSSRPLTGLSLSGSDILSTSLADFYAGADAEADDVRPLDGSQSVTETSEAEPLVSYYLFENGSAGGRDQIGAAVSETRGTIYHRAEVQVILPGRGYMKCDPEQYESLDAFYNSLGFERYLQDLNCELDEIKQYLDSFFPDTGSGLPMFTDAFNFFKDKVNDRAYPFTIWGKGRDDLHDVCELLGRPDIPDSTKKEALFTLCDSLDMCAERVASNIFDAKTRLSLGGKGRLPMLEKARLDLFTEQIANTLRYADFLYVEDGGSDTYFPHVAAYCRKQLGDQLGLPPSGDPAADGEHGYIKHFKQHYPYIMDYIVEEFISSGKSILSPVAICNHIVKKYGDIYEKKLNEIKMRHFQEGPVRVDGGAYDAFVKEVGEEVLRPIFELLEIKPELYELGDYCFEEGDGEYAGDYPGHLDFGHFNINFRKLVGKAFNEDFGISYATPAGSLDIKLDEGRKRLIRPYDGDIFLVVDASVPSEDVDKMLEESKGGIPEKMAFLQPEDLDGHDVVKHKSEVLQAVLRYLETRNQTFPNACHAVATTSGALMELSYLDATATSRRNKADFVAKVVPVMEGLCQSDDRHLGIMWDLHLPSIFSGGPGDMFVLYTELAKLHVSLSEAPGAQAKKKMKFMNELARRVGQVMLERLNLPIIAKDSDTIMFANGVDEANKVRAVVLKREDMQGVASLLSDRKYRCFFRNQTACKARLKKLWDVYFK